jgi:flagella basal body P-ring formation protein FlgA
MSKLQTRLQWKQLHRSEAIVEKLRTRVSKSAPSQQPDQVECEKRAAQGALRLTPKTCDKHSSWLRGSVPVYRTFVLKVADC